VSYSSYFCVAHKNARVYPSLLEASWNLVGSKTFDVYLAKWRHPSWKWPVRHSAVAGKCKLSNIDLHGGIELLGRDASFPASFALERKVKPNLIGYPFAILSMCPYRPSWEFCESGNAWLYRTSITHVRMEPGKHLCFYGWTWKLCYSLGSRFAFDIFDNSYYNSQVKFLTR